ncbi:hypothetical protein N7481_010225 [Penicillium waksmanii]|uniref:uncharacterized protein n=1 Tax=Penicillium waksmanii TaxID=69791 RepID=UPI002547E6FF|nr:uncharacterized protein N7481_010225 [Penicillium waksmanii]KAJ5976518.1 hypothetical protein N7481_010225 [Penicillium waksmanii]
MSIIRVTEGTDRPPFSNIEYDRSHGAERDARYTAHSSSRTVGESSLVLNGSVTNEDDSHGVHLHQMDGGKLADGNLDPASLIHFF